MQEKTVNKGERDAGGKRRRRKMCKKKTCKSKTHSNEVQEEEFTGVRGVGDKKTYKKACRRIIFKGMMTEPEL